MTNRLMTILLSTYIGAIFAFTSIDLYVDCQTAAPDFNPADHEILVYGD